MNHISIPLRQIFSELRESASWYGAFSPAYLLYVDGALDVSEGEPVTHPDTGTRDVPRRNEPEAWACEEIRMLAG